MPIERNRLQKIINERGYLAKDFESIRIDLEKFAKKYYPDTTTDYSDTGVLSMLLDLIAYQGDNQSFYLDHQFWELDPETTIEIKNLNRIFNKVGIKSIGSSPARAKINLSIVVDAESINGVLQPKSSMLATIKEGTVFASQNGILYELLENVSFDEVDENSNLVAKIEIEKRDQTTNEPTKYKLTRQSTVLSGTRVIEEIDVGDSFIPFREISLAQPNITEIISVYDSEGNRYYEVESLSQDVIFDKIPNRGEDADRVPYVIQIVPCPYRFVTRVDIESGKTILRFGSGTGVSVKGNTIPDPADVSIPLYGKRTLSRLSLAPSSLLNSGTLGISPTSTTLSIDYRYGGGVSHNIQTGELSTVDSLVISYPVGITQREIEKVRNSITVENYERGYGGSDAPSIDDLRNIVASANLSQSRIVEDKDILTRIYTMPSSFGRVFRAAVRSNTNSYLNAQLFVVGINQTSNLEICADTTKRNLSKYLNQFRLISDSIDILDAKITNIKLDFAISVDALAKPQAVLSNCIVALKQYFRIQSWQINQVIYLDEVREILRGVSGVAAVLDIQIKNLSGTVSNRSYSDVSVDLSKNVKKGIIVPPVGGIFEIKYPDYDIVGKVA